MDLATYWTQRPPGRIAPSSLPQPAPVGGRIPDPPVTSGLVGYYSARAVVGVADGAALTSWADLSGVGNNTASATGTPVWEATTGQTGGPAVLFSTTDTYFTLPNLLAGAAAGEVFVTAKSNNAGVQTSWWKFGTEAGSPLNHYPFSTGNYYDDFGSTVRRGPITPTLGIVSWRRLNQWSAAGDWASLLDEVSQFTDASNTVAWAAAPALGGKGFMDAAANIRYGCVLVYNRKLTAPERAATAAWLAAYPSGGTTTLPAGPTAITAPDTAAGVDAATLTTALTAADTAHGADTASVSTGTPISAADTASGANVATLAAALTGADTAHAVDAASVTTGVAVHTLTGNLGDLIGGDIRNARAYMVGEDDVVVVGGEVRLGDLKIPLAAGQTFTLAGLPVGNYRIRVDYYAAGSNRTWTTPLFGFTADSDLATILDAL